MALSKFSFRSAFTGPSAGDLKRRRTMLIGTEGFQAEADQGLRILQVFSTSSFDDATCP